MRPALLLAGLLLASIASSARERLQGEAVRVFESQVAPALRKLRAYLDLLEKNIKAWVAEEKATQ